MNAVVAMRYGAAAVLLFVVLAFPWLRHMLDASMAMQMLVQIPLLALVGWFVGAAIPRSWRARIDPWNANGITALVVATFASACWMLPRALDAAAADPAIALAKYVSVPLLIGAPLALGWPRMSFVVRGVFVVEGIASLFRLGWLYTVSPIRLCSRYPIADQQRVGACLLALGAALLVAVAWKLLFGRFDAGAPAQARMSGYHRVQA